MWTKKVKKPINSDIIEMRGSLNLEKDFDTSKYPHNANGTLKIARTVYRRISDS